MILMRGKVMHEKQGGLDVRKVILQNARHSARDYFIYLLTVTLALALMYAFHLLAFSDEIRALCSMLNTITGIVLAISLIVIFAVGWMISYMSRFILERRSREFALYMLSGIPDDRGSVRTGKYPDGDRCFSGRSGDGNILIQDVRPDHRSSV